MSMPKRRNNNEPAPGYQRIVVDLHRTQIKFIRETQKAQAEASGRSVTRSDIIREALLGMHRNQIDENASTSWKVLRLGNNAYSMK